jgi:hypothetical protein
MFIMLREAENYVKVEGILSEVDLNYGSYQREGKTIDMIAGSIKVRVDQKIDGEIVQLEVPIHMFAGKYTNVGRLNPAYESIEKIMKNFTSIAAAGGEEGADLIRVNSGKIRMNEYYTPDGRFISFPRIHASFVTKVKRQEFKPEASFSMTFVVADKQFELDKEGVETGRYQVKGIVPQYGGKVDIIDFIASSESVINAVDQYWEKGDTVRCVGRLNFSSTNETITKEVDFGEPQEIVRTISVSDLIITGGSSTPLEGDFAYDMDEINEAIAARKAALEEQKERDMNRGKRRNAPGKDTSKLDSLGF